ncbi:ketosteroid isomerase family protein [Mycolicibacterium sp. 3033]|nr:ketosteroid isomerase family protein [Mycolicibacterium aurantiacum]
MASPRTDVLSAARQSLAAAGAHDRSGWLALFAAGGRVEDPVGSSPHRGRAAIGHFYDTFIGPREISYDLDHDLVAGATVLRDLTLVIEMSPTLTMAVPAYIRYDMAHTADGLRIAALSAYWELPAMIRRFLRGGPGALPAGVALGRAMAAHQGLRGGAGFLRGFAGTGSGAAKAFGRVLDDACAGDEVGLRRGTAGVVMTAGDAEPRTASDVVRLLSGGRWDKRIRSGRSVVARVYTADRPVILIGEYRARGTDRAELTRLRVFTDTD